MKKLLFIFTVLSVLTSCGQRHAKYESYVYFNEEEFNKMKAAWEKQNLKNYSFEYKFEDTPPSGHFTGKVRVIDGKGSVKIENVQFGLAPKESHLYYIENVDELFEAIYKRYRKDKQILEDSTKLEEYWSSSIAVKYDEKNFYPLKLKINSSTVSLSEVRKGVVGGWYHGKLTVSDFKITE